MRAALIGVCVPAAGFGESDFQSDIGFDELRDLLQRFTETPTRILRAIRRIIRFGVQAAHDFQCINGFRAAVFKRVREIAAFALRYFADRRAIHCLETAAGIVGFALTAFLSGTNGRADVESF